MPLTLGTRASLSPVQSVVVALEWGKLKYCSEGSHLFSLKILLMSC